MWGHITSEIDVNQDYTPNKLILHSSFKNTITDLNNLNIILPSNPSSQDIDFSMYTYPPDGVLLAKIEDISKIKLNPANGELLVGKYLVCGYDESINKFNGLERGTAFLTSHSLIIQKHEYIPTVITTFYFYTRSKFICDNSKFIKYSADVDTDSKMDYVYDRNEFLINYTPSNSIVLIDGPLIGGQISSFTIRLNHKLLANNILPIFFIKNSLSTLVIDNIKELKGKYNSDMHWAYSTLKPGERTNFFRYQDLKSSQAKIFCYLKV